MSVSAVNLLIDSLLPEDLQNSERLYDKKGLGDLLSEVAKRYPDLYPKLSHTLAKIGQDQVWRRGETFRLADFKPVIDRKPFFSELDKREKEIRKTTQDPAALKDALGTLYGEISDRISKETNRASLANKNNIAITVVTGARGKDAQLRDLLSTPGFYVDSNSHTIPGFIRQSYAEGLRPADYLAGTYGARSSVTHSKRMTAKGGFYGKSLGRAAATTYVTENDCGTSNGISLPITEKDIRGRVLQRETAGLPGGSIIDRKGLEKLKASKTENLLVRSPMTCQAEHGICSKCYGVMANGKLPKVGEHVGYTSAQAISEPVIQSALCLVEGSQVRMADFSTKEIQALSPGDWVMGSDKQGNTFPVEVTALHNQGLQESFRYQFRVGSSQQLKTLESTPDHKILANKKVSGADYKEKFNGEFGYGHPDNYQTIILPVGYKHKNLAAVLPSSCTVPGIREPLALMIGVFLGDGIRSPEGGKYVPTFSCAEPLLVADLQAHLRPFELSIRKMKRSHDHSVATEREAYVSKPRKNAMKAVLSRLGLLHCYAHEKFIPAEVWGWDTPSVIALVAGYLAADGSVFRGDKNVIIQFGSVAKPLLEGFKRLLEERLCVYAGPIHPGAKAGTGCYTHDAWTFTISREDQIRKFRDLIPNIPGKKGVLLDQYLSELTGKLRHPEFFVRAKRHKDAEALGNRQCWDITVDHPDHLFVLANGLIVSNSLKHVTSASGPKTEFAGLEYLNQVAESPEEFKDRSVVTQVDGNVENISDAPQGGKYVTVGGQEHYVAPDRFITVQKGQTLEAGDALTDGLVDPEDVMKHKGLGAARAYWAEAMSKISKASGAGGDRRLFETMARAAVDHVDLDDPIEEGFLPDDRVHYSQYVKRRMPPKNVVELPASKAIGKYLEAPAMHHTIGTRVTPSMAQDLTAKGFDKLQVSPTEPGFRPAMVRLTQVSSVDDDWLASLGGSYLGNQLREGITRAQDTNIESNYHPIPRLAVGVGYADKLEETGKF